MDLAMGAVDAAFHDIAMLFQRAMDWVGPARAVGGEGRLEHKHATFTDVGAKGQKPAQRRLVAAVGDQDGVRRLVGPVPRLDVADLVEAMSAQPKQGRQATLARDVDHA